MAETARQEWKRGPLLGFAAAILAMTVCVIGAAASAGAIGHPHHAPTVVLSLLAAAFILATIGLLRVAIHLEHGLRGPVKPRLTLYDLAAAAPAPSTASTARQPKNSPNTRLFFIALILALGGLLIWLAITLNSRATRSAFTQHHGVSRTGTVTQVHRIHHSSRTSSYNTYEYDVALSNPVNGRDTTRVHDPSQNRRDFFTGEPITVLVDPKQPSYAEIPGMPAISSKWWISIVTIGGVFVLVGGFVAWEQKRHRRHRKTVHAAAAQPAAPTLP